MRFSLAFTVSLAAPLALALPVTAATLTVGPAGSSAMFTEIHAAVAAAQPGDTILVQPGSYAGFFVGKPLHILGQGPGVQIALAPWLVDIAGIPAGAELSLSGLESPTGIRVANCSGRVELHGLAFARAVIEDAAFVAADACAFQLGGISALRSEVWISGSSLVGSNGPSSAFCGTQPAGPGEPALRLDQSVAYVARTTCIGGWGGKMVCIPNTSYQGGAGVRASSSTLKFVGGGTSEIRGGSSQPGSSIQLGGGYALHLTDGSQVLTAAAVPMFSGLTGGAGGALPDFHLITTGAEHYDLGIVYPTHALTPPRGQLGGSFALAIDGNPGALVRTWGSLGWIAPLSIGGIDGALILDPASAFVLGGAVLDANGKATLAGSVPLDPTLVGLLPVFQTLELGPAIALSNPSTLAIFG